MKKEDKGIAIENIAKTISEYSSFYLVETAVFTNRFRDILNCDTFIFLFHFVVILEGD